MPTMADVPRLIYTRAVLAESMRLYPPAWIVGRQATEEFALAGTPYAVAAGGVVLMSQFLVHRDERWWEEPGVFRPERWVEPEDGEMRGWGDGERKNQASRPRYAYFPFGGGPRQCIGEAFAGLEGVLLLATLAQRWRFRLATDRPVRLHATITLRPREELLVRVEGRG